jgi:hypothetical protein
MPLTLGITTIGASKLSASSPLVIAIIIPTLVSITVTRIIRTRSIVIATGRSACLLSTVRAVIITHEVCLDIIIYNRYII